jgi:hypothetical protein
MIKFVHANELGLAVEQIADVLGAQETLSLAGAPTCWISPSV